LNVGPYDEDSKVGQSTLHCLQVAKHVLRSVIRYLTDINLDK